MVIRSLVASTILAGQLFVGGASAQVLLCPKAPPPDTRAADIPAEAERLLKRLTIALDLHGHRGIDEDEILRTHAETPSALLGKLGNVVDRCVKESGDLKGFHDALPGLRKAFLAATNIADPVDGGSESGSETTVLATKEAERVEESIDLSVRELWRKLWFRPADTDGENDRRWAVIVASPADAERGWDMLGEHQRRWIDAYFQLHEPYYESNPHHAIVVGRRLPEEQASRLRNYVVELGMASDAYIWALPDESVNVTEGRTFKIESDEVEKPPDGELEDVGSALLGRLEDNTRR
ncbi:MAG: hypothetical protein AAGA21_08500 [Pseudomonadota bacterium]